MDTTAYKVFDDAGRIVLPRKLRAQLNWGAEVQLAVHFCTKTGRIVLSPTEGDVDTQLDELGNILLSPRLREAMGWLYIDEGDTIAISVCPWERVMYLSLHQKHERKCVFCKRPESFATLVAINRHYVCEHCAAIISNANRSISA